MSISFLSIRAFIPAVCLLSAWTVTVTPAFSQQTAPAAQQAAPAQQTPPANSATAQTPAPATQSAPPAASKEPDYPDPRGFFIGITGLTPLTTSGPDIRGGVIASQDLTYESLFGIGSSYRIVPEIEAGIPVTRTGMLYLDLERFHGSGSQTLTAASFVDSFSYNTGDYMLTTYHINTGRLYLDDLLFPHKFPVSRLRFKSIWGLRYIGVTQTVISPTEDDISGTPGGSFGLGTNSILFPEFGAAMEYALAKHALFRIDGAGFGIPHRATMYETSATLSVRRKNLEMLMGVKVLGFKTNPQKEEYVTDTLITPFVGFRWYW